MIPLIVRNLSFQVITILLVPISINHVWLPLDCHLIILSTLITNLKPSNTKATLVKPSLGLHCADKGNFNKLGTRRELSGLLDKWDKRKLVMKYTCEHPHINTRRQTLARLMYKLTAVYLICAWHCAASAKAVMGGIQVPPITVQHYILMY